MTIIGKIHYEFVRCPKCGRVWKMEWGHSKYDHWHPDTIYCTFGCKKKSPWTDDVVVTREEWERDLYRQRPAWEYGNEV